MTEKTKTKEVKSDWTDRAIIVGTRVLEVAGIALLTGFASRAGQDLYGSMKVRRIESDSNVIDLEQQKKIASN